MLTFTAKEAKNRLGEVLRAAESMPVQITNHGKPVVRILSIKQADKLMQGVNQHDVLDSLKHRISCEVLARFSIAVIRQQARDNLARWRTNGAWSHAYDEWQAIIESNDDQCLIARMVGLDQESNRLRQSMPYVGLLDQARVRQLPEEIAP